MITYDEALKTIRKSFPDFYVTEGFEYDGNFCFQLVSKHYKELPMDSSHFYSVNSESGSVQTLNYSAICRDPSAFINARTSGRKIDEIPN